MATLKPLASFDNSQSPNGTFEDASGNLFGTTDLGGTGGGSLGLGTVFEIPFTNGTYAATPTVLVNFNNTTGDTPNTTLIEDAAGDLFGETAAKGPDGFGTVFEVPFTNGTYASTPTTVAGFDGTDGQEPLGGVISVGGSLFGTTNTGGPNGAGEVFEIPFTNGTYASTPTPLVGFNGAAGDGSTLQAGLIADSDGNLFGTTRGGNGSVFEIPLIDGTYASTPTTLVKFNGTDGSQLYGGVVEDTAGDLFGTTFQGGADSDGTVFEIPFINGTYASTPTPLITFDGSNGSFPVAGLIIDTAGNLFGTTQDGGSGLGGTVFELPLVDGSYATTPTELVSFNGSNGQNPDTALTVDAAGDLFGSTSGGVSGDGSVFEITGSGFVTCFRRGTMIATPDGERAVESFAAGDRVLTTSGAAQPIVWIGHRHIDCRRHARPEAVWPVRVLAGAFGSGTPHRDLWLSPDHAVFIDDVLIPIRYLINGVTIEQVPQGDIAYYHIELFRHDMLLAEGLPAESYLNTGNRFAFDNGGGPVSLHPDFITVRWEGAGCAPLIVTGPKLQAARRYVNVLAAMLPGRPEVEAEHTARR